MHVNMHNYNKSAFIFLSELINYISNLLEMNLDLKSMAIISNILNNKVDIKYYNVKSNKNPLI